MSSDTEGLTEDVQELSVTKTTGRLKCANGPTMYTGKRFEVMRDRTITGRSFFGGDNDELHYSYSCVFSKGQQEL